MIARTVQGNNAVDIQKALEQSLIDGYKPTLAIAFVSVKQDTKTVCNILNDAGIQIFGSTTSGEFISPKISEGGIAIMLLDMKPEDFKIIFFETGNNSAFEAAKQLGAEGKKIFTNSAFIIASGWLHTDGEQIVKGIEEGYASEVTLFGGMAGDDLALREPFVFTCGKQSTTGIVALIINKDKIDVNGIATCGWKPIGITKTITKSSGNIVHSIDDKPALDLVIKYLGLNLDDKASDNMVVNLGAYYPLQLQRENAPPVMRTTMLGNKEDRSLICAGTVPQGSKVRFSLPPDFDVIDTVVKDCTDMKNEEQGEADAMIIFSCISRYLSFGMMTGEEIERVQQVWNVPFVGFFSYGEFGKSKLGKHEFHNNTCCVVVLKEKN
jgi:hypothetical protein